MRCRLVLASSWVVLALLVGTPARAAGVHDPETTWRTIETPRFLVHYPDGARNLGIRVSRMAEEELDRVTELVGFVPKTPIEIVISSGHHRSRRVSPAAVGLAFG